MSFFLVLQVSKVVEKGVIKQSTQMEQFIRQMASDCKLRLEGASVFIINTVVDAKENNEKLAKLFLQDIEVASEIYYKLFQQRKTFFFCF